METRINIINKIVNLLAKADSTQYEAEAETARKLAAKLMANYEVEKSELEKDEKIIVYTFNSGNQKRKNIKKTILFNIICEYCGVYCVSCGTDHIMTGKNVDMEAALYMFNLIWNQIKQISDNWYKVNKSKVTVTKKNNYIMGMIFGVQYNLDKINKGVFKYKQESGLVAINQNINDFNKAKETFEKNNEVKDKKIKQEKNKAFTAGFSDSEKVKMVNGVNHNSKTYAINY